MMLAATRGGTADALFAELQGKPAADAGLAQAQLGVDAAEGLPLGRRRCTRSPTSSARTLAAHELYVGAAHFYEQIARDFEDERNEVSALEAFLGKGAAS